MTTFSPLILISSEENKGGNPVDFFSPQQLAGRRTSRERIVFSSSGPHSSRSLIDRERLATGATHTNKGRVRKRAEKKKKEPRHTTNKQQGPKDRTASHPLSEAPTQDTREMTKPDVHLNLKRKKRKRKTTKQIFHFLPRKTPIHTDTLLLFTSYSPG
jgi:hypothetical protein